MSMTFFFHSVKQMFVYQLNRPLAIITIIDAAPSFLVSPAAIEACLGHSLKRRAAGFLRSDKIAALFTKVGKVYDVAGEICRKAQEQLQQQADLTRFGCT